MELNKELIIAELERIIKYNFNNTDLLVHAVTHTSYAHEYSLGVNGSNERLEFLGDTVMNMIVSEYIYSHKPEISEGDMTKIRSTIICEACLYKVAQQLKYGEFILLGKGEEKSGGRNRASILADAFEAITAAIFLDGGLENAKKFVLSNLAQKVDEAILNIGKIDNKTRLQEILQQVDNSRKISYEIVDERGLEHSKEYFAVIKWGNAVLGKGSGKSKKEAEQKAAGEAIKKIEE